MGCETNYDAAAWEIAESHSHMPRVIAKTRACNRQAPAPVTFRYHADRTERAVASARMCTHAPVSFAEATRTWMRIGLLSFGGPAGQIAGHASHPASTRKRWIGESDSCTR